MIAGSERRGGRPALTDLLGGKVQIMFATISSSIEYIEAGKLRALAESARDRDRACRGECPVAAASYQAYFLMALGSVEVVIALLCIFRSRRQG